MRSTVVRDRPTESDLAGDFSNFARDALQPWMKAYDSWRSGIEDLLESRPRGRKSSKGRCCSRCGEDECHCRRGKDDCHCRCCVVNADLVVEARVGERRVVPITIENRWRREREIELELSSWTAIEAGVPVEGQIGSPVKFTLPPCGDKTIVLMVEIGAGAEGRRFEGDVKQCAVSYADLRIKGCDLRSIRIAVAVLPRDCDDYVVDCTCGCC